MITLYTFGPLFGLPDPSPFVVKAEILLKMADLEYRTDTSGFRRAPKGKLPFIDDDGKQIADSTFIRWHLEEKYRFDFDRGLTSGERGTAWAVDKMLEDHVYWAMIDSRWMNDENFNNGPAVFFNSIPLPMRGLVRKMVRGKVRRSLQGHGFGLHTTVEIERLTARAMQAVAEILGDKPYLMGSQPCGADATAYAFVSGLLCPHFDSPIRKDIQRHANLVAYSERLTRQFFPSFS
jgi:glutathione S-transferase